MTYEQRPGSGPASPDIEFFEPDCPEPHLGMGCQMIRENGEVDRCHLLDEQGYCTWEPHSSTEGANK